MSGQDLMTELMTKASQLELALRQLRIRGRDYAEKERNYRMALSQKMLLERDNGLPVTILSDVCRGDRKIAGLKFQRDLSEITYKSALEAINVYKLQIKTLENQIDREYRG